MGRILLAALAVLVMPKVSQACDNQMNVSVRQVGPPIRVVQKKRAAEFIVFRGDMRMQNEEIAMANKAQQQEHVSLMEQALASTEPPAESVTIKSAPPKVAVKKVEPKKAPLKAIVAKKDSSKKAIAKNTAKTLPAKKEALKGAKRTLTASTKAKKHRVQRSPASIGPAIVVANQ
jgi:hypothetical protein